jgi:hypothetical protein
MSEQLWTLEGGTLITNYETFKIGKYRAKHIADAHNAAIAAERHHHKQEEIAATELTKQLAAEREKYTGDDYATMDDARNRILDLERDLAALKRQDEVHWKTRRTLLKELAAEREGYEKVVKDLAYHVECLKKETGEKHRLRQQLAAEQEKVALATQMVHIESKRANEAHRERIEACEHFNAQINSLRAALAAERNERRLRTAQLAAERDKRKLLVEALKEAREVIEEEYGETVALQSPLIKRIDDALAKEGK